MFAGQDVEAQRQRAKEEFDVPGVREAFIRKVCILLTVQLVFTLGAMLLTMTVQDVTSWVMDQDYLAGIAVLAFIWSIFAFLCCRNETRYPPCNFVILGVITIAQAFILSFITAYYPSGVILLAVGLAGLVVFAMAMFALQTKIDLTLWSGVILTILILFFCFPFILGYFPNLSRSYIYAAIGVVIFSMLVVYHIQLVVGGGAYSWILTPNDYVFAAASLYIDIILLFLFFLELIGING